MGTRTNEQYTLLTDYDTHSAYSEAYRTLYANICLDWRNESAQEVHIELQPSHIHTLLLTAPAITGPVTNSEYATVAANLAIVAAQSGTPTILVDANLRAPHLQQRFGLAKGNGLSELLTGTAVASQEVASLLQTTFVPNLRLLSAGTATEQAIMLMISSKLAEVICAISRWLEETEAKSGIIIFHGLPVLSGADASLIGTLVERTFLTIAAGHTTRKQAKQAQEQLERAEIKLAGIITIEV